MNKKIKRILEPNMRLYFLVFLIFVGVSFFSQGHETGLGIAGICVLIVMIVYFQLSGRKRRQELMKYIESVTYNVDAAAKDSLHNFPLPMMVFTISDGKIVSTNDSFQRMVGGREHFFELHVGDVAQNFNTKWLMEGKVEAPELTEIGGKKYRVYGGLVRTEHEAGVGGYLATTYWVDVTDYAKISARFAASRPVFAIILLDNYDEFLKGLSEKEKSSILSMIDDRISDWAGTCGAYLSKYDRDRYIFVFEEQYLKGFIDGKFALLDAARDITNPKGLHATISIGIGRDGKNYAENFKFAGLSIEMALSRGGDQAVIKNRYNFEFYGGRSTEMEKRTKVKSRVMANSLSELMNDASCVYIMGHKYADLDSIGAAIGLCCAARKKEKRVRIVVDMDANSAGVLIKRMLSLPEYSDVFVSPQDAILEADGSSLLIIVDTNRPEQVESEALLLSCNRIAVIDHHRRAATYIQNAALSFHEPYASSASELVTELLQYMVDQLDILRYEAEALLAGIVLDTKNFSLRTGGRTFDAAAFLRRAGADTTDVKRLLQSDIHTAMARYAIIQKAKVYKAGIAIAAADTAQDRVIAAQAADELLNISGIQASFVVFPEHDTVFISARSLSDINVQVILEKLGGGGNKSTAGAQIHGKSLKDVIRELLEVIDTYLAENKTK